MALAARFHRPTRDDQLRGVIASIVHLVAIVAEVAPFDARLATTVTVFGVCGGGSTKSGSGRPRRRAHGAVYVARSDTSDLLSPTIFRRDGRGTTPEPSAPQESTTRLPGEARGSRSPPVEAGRVMRLSRPTGARSEVARKRRKNRRWAMVCCSVARPCRLHSLWRNVSTLSPSMLHN